MASPYRTSLSSSDKHSSWSWFSSSADGESAGFLFLNAVAEYSFGFGVLRIEVVSDIQTGNAAEERRGKAGSEDVKQIQVIATEVTLRSPRCCEICRNSRTRELTQGYSGDPAG